MGKLSYLFRRLDRKKNNEENKADIINKLSDMFSANNFSNQSIDLDTFSSADLVTDLDYDSLTS